MATFQASVAASADDALEIQNDTGFDSTVAVLTANSGTSDFNRQISGMRFDTVTIPAKATITACTIDIETLSTFTDSPKIHIYCEDVDDAPDFSTNADVFNRAKTTANVAWDAVDIGVGVKTSPDFTAALQEVIDRPGWASGQAIDVLFEGDDAAGRAFGIAAWDHATAAPAELNVTYTLPGGAVNSMAGAGGLASGGGIAGAGGGLAG